jgi:hypothetical protein
MRNVPGSNPGQDTDYRDWGSRNFTQSIMENAIVPVQSGLRGLVSFTHHACLLCNVYSEDGTAIRGAWTTLLIVRYY